MSAERRPGGLTALAVLNFVWGGIIAIISLLGMAAVGVTQTAVTSGAPLTVTTTSPTGEVTTKELDKAEITKGVGLAWVVVFLGALIGALLIASGVGYMGQKRFLGRILGNAYALLSIAWSGLSIVSTGFGIMTLIFLVYPLLTLLLVNTTFKPDLVN